MDSLLLILAALIAFGSAVFHGWFGGKLYMSHVTESHLVPLMQSVSLVSWHMFTVFLVVSGATLICVAMKPELALLSYPILMGNALGAALFLLLSAKGHAPLLKMPGMYLMLLTALLGWLGVN
jgi:hypothetical protein